jgi:hypothetical protein
VQLKRGGWLVIPLYEENQIMTLLIRKKMKTQFENTNWVSICVFYFEKTRMIYALLLRNPSSLFFRSFTFRSTHLSFLIESGLILFGSFLML